MRCAVTLLTPPLHFPYAFLAPHHMSGQDERNNRISGHSISSTSCGLAARSVHTGTRWAVQASFPSSEQSCLCSAELFGDVGGIEREDVEYLSTSV
jgi:hypothetical protein